MLSGYNNSRPTKDQYEDFEGKFVDGLSNLGIEGLSLILYGSYIRGTYIPGRSDIDAWLIMPDEYEIDKKNLLSCAEVLNDAQVGNHIPIQFSVSDLGTARDGRFSAYGKDFEEYFKEEGKILLGPNYLPQFRFDRSKESVLHTSSYNLRKSRQRLLYSRYLQETDPEKFISAFQNSIEVATNCAKHIVYMIDGRLIPDRFSSMRRIKEEFPNTQFEVVDEIRRILGNVEELDSIYQNPDKMRLLWIRALGFQERLIGDYIRKYPRKEEE